jgi:DNA helicase-2/ATP-dependent DNA helicase PcrA
VFLLETEDDEAEFVYREIEHFKTQGYHPKDMAVLYRSNSQGGMIESVFRTYHIPYTVSGGTGFFDRKEVKDILAYLRSALAPNDVSLRRIINTPARGIGDNTIEKISDYAKHKKISFNFACKAALRGEDLEINSELNDSNPQQELGGLSPKQGSFFQTPEIELATGSKEALRKFFDNLKQLPEVILKPIGSQTAGEALVEWMRSIGYRDYVFSMVSEPSSGEKKWNLVEIVGRVLDSFVKRGGLNEKTLKDFLDAMELRDETEDEENADRVSLMTLHACKGLEFPVVIIVGIEEDLLPHKTLGSDIDEERRLFYVGVTRAKEKLVMTRCKTRRRHGVVRPVSPSRFLLEISSQHVRDYKCEFRPVSSVQRESLLSDFLGKLDSKIQSQQAKPKDNTK